MKHQTQHTPEHHEAVEAWHHHSADEGQPQEEHAGKVNTRALGVVFFSIVLFFIATATASILYFVRYTTELRQKKIETHAWATQFSEDYQRQVEGLQQYAWADAAAGTVQVPLDIARRRVIEKYGK
jgi:hypothetical protein